MPWFGSPFSWRWRFRSAQLAHLSSLYKLTSDIENFLQIISVVSYKSALTKHTMSFVPNHTRIRENWNSYHVKKEGMLSIIQSHNEIKCRKLYALRSLILTDLLGCNASMPNGYLMCDMPYTREEHRDSSVEVSTHFWNVQEKTVNHHKPHLQETYSLFLEACPKLKELGYRTFCEHEAWERMKGCKSNITRFVYGVCSKINF